MIRPSPSLAVVLLAVALRGTPARAAEPSGGGGPLTLERITDGTWPGIGPGAPAITWIPGEDAWLEWRQDDDPATKPGPDSEVLVRVNARSGDATVIASAGALDRATEVAGRRNDVLGMRGIGRRGPPRLTMAPDGSAVVVVWRGAALVRVDLRLERPPLVLPVGEADPRTPDLRPITDVRVAEEGRRVSYVRDHDVATVLVEGEPAPHGVERLVAREVRATSGGTELARHGELDWVYAEELDATTATWWSPDGSRFVHLDLDEATVPRFPIVDPTAAHGSTYSQFYPYVGDHNPVASMRVTSPDAGTDVTLDLDLRPGEECYAPYAFWAWRKLVVVAVLDRRQTHFELRACDPETGRSRPIWRERSDTWIDLPPPPVVVSRYALGTYDDRFLIRSRRDGFWRIWLVPFDPSSPPSPLTPSGEDCLDVLAMDWNAGVFFHGARSKDGLRDLVRRVRLDGGGSTTLLDDGFSHATSWSITGHVFVDTMSTITSPPHTVVRDADGTIVRELSDAATDEFRALGLARPEFLTLPAADGTPLSAVLWGPRELDPAHPRPLLVYGYGGPGSRMVADAWQGGNGLVRVLVDAGFLVLTVDGRGTGGHGRAFEAVVHRRLGEIEAADQASAVHALAARPGVDATRVGVWGGSYGGFLALSCVLHRPETFRAAVAVAPVTDWRLYDSIYTERYMGLLDDNAAGYAATSIVEHAKELRGDVLVLHGLSDDNVHAQNTLRLADACLAAGVPLDWTIYPRRGHGIDGGGARIDVYRRILGHFRRALGSGGPGGR